jgi:hypothetical protein
MCVKLLLGLVLIIFSFGTTYAGDIDTSEAKKVVGSLIDGIFDKEVGPDSRTISKADQIDHSSGRRLKEHEPLTRKPKIHIQEDEAVDLEAPMDATIENLRSQIQGIQETNMQREVQAKEAANAAIQLAEEKAKIEKAKAEEDRNVQVREAKAIQGRRQEELKTGKNIADIRSQAIDLSKENTDLRVEIANRTEEARMKDIELAELKKKLHAAEIRNGAEQQRLELAKTVNNIIGDTLKDPESVQQ